MSTHEKSPSDATLLAFDRGMLPPEEIDAVAEWLRANPDGEERLRTLTEGVSDAVVDALRATCGLTEEIAKRSGLTSRVVERVLAPGDQPSDVPQHLGEYQILWPLGRGGMGSVYRARHARLKRDVAVKILLPHVALDPAYRARFEREMAAIGQLDHPHLIRAHDAGADGTNLYLVMDLLEGRDLAGLLAEHGPLRIADACEIIRQAALGLQYAHKHGLVHRDVKPANLFLTHSGVVKVIDLGLARGTPGLTSQPGLSTAKTMIGTPDCMAPEQWEHTTVDPRADLYSLGCTFFALLTGTPPFSPQVSDSWVAWCEAHRSEPPPDLRKRRPEAPAGIAELVARLLAKKPDQRPASGQVVAAALEPFTHGHNLPALFASDTPLPDSVDRGVGAATGANRRWLPAALVCATLVVVGLVVVGLTRQRGKPNGTSATPSIVEAAKAPVADAMADRSGPIIIASNRTLQLHSAGVVSVAFSPNGKVLASGGQDRLIYLWDTKDWTARGPLKGHVGNVVALAFTADSATLASVTSAAGPCRVRLWDVAGARPSGTLGGENKGTWGVAFSPDGRTIACGGWDCAVQVMDVATGTERYTIPNASELLVRTVSISPDGRWLAAGGRGPARLWEFADGKEVPALLPDGMAPSFFPDSQEVAGWIFLRGIASICTIPSGKVRALWRAHEQTIMGLGISPDGRFVATFSNKGPVRIWATADQSEVASLVGHRGEVSNASFSPDGKTLATAGTDDLTVRVWDLPAIFHVKN